MTDITEIDPNSIHIGTDITPDLWTRFTPQQTMILRGAFAGRVIPIRYSKMKNGRPVPSWIDICGSVDAAGKVLGHEVLAGNLQMTVDHVNVRIGGVRVRTDRSTCTNYKVFGKAEAVIRQMPARFTYRDLLAARSSTAVAGVNRTSLAATLYLHVIAGTLEYIPNPHMPHDPSFRKLSTYLDPQVL